MITPKQNLAEEVVARNARRERSLDKRAARSADAVRRRAESVPDPQNPRPAYSHDTDRIIHSMAYARYLGKTQVFFQVGNDHITRRVLHVQLVSKIARTLSRFLNANEDLAEAIALAHDIGHTPFGHTGEDILAECMEESGAGSFLHSAQSVRVLESIERGGRGLNLSLQVLDGIIGHNGEIVRSEISFSPSNLSFERLDRDLKKCLTLPRSEKYEKRVFPSTFEGCIVRVSDMIAYIGRDFEDAISLGLLKRADIPSNVARTLGDTNSTIVNSLCMDIVNNSRDGRAVRFSDAAYGALLEMKKFSISKIYNHKRIKEQIRRFKPMMKALFSYLVEDAKSGCKKSELYRYFLKPLGEKYCEETPPERQVADFIASMTDDYFMELYKRIFMPEKIDYGKKFERY